jgi:hypothetical protein
MPNLGHDPVLTVVFKSLQKDLIQDVLVFENYSGLVIRDAAGLMLVLSDMRERGCTNETWEFRRGSYNSFRIAKRLTSVDRSAPGVTFALCVPLDIFMFASLWTTPLQPS